MSVYLDSENFQQATKQDVKLAPANSTTRIGKTIANTARGSGKTVSVYSKGAVLGVRHMKTKSLGLCSFSVIADLRHGLWNAGGCG